VWGAKPRLAASGAPQLRERLNYRSSESRPADAGTLGLTGTMEPASTQPRWLGEKPAPVTRRWSHLNSRPPLTDEVLLFAPRLMQCPSLVLPDTMDL
jgi:hypothetical protein